MKNGVMFFLLLTHLVALGCGFALGVYTLPILIAPPAPDAQAVEAVAQNSQFVGTFSRDRADSDTLHWGEGEIAISSDSISFMGSLAPGPDYRLYLSPEFVETEADFKRLKADMVQVAEVRTFDNFIVPVPDDIDPSQYSAAIVWCERFSQFITSASYQAR